MYIQNKEYKELNNILFEQLSQAEKGTDKYIAIRNRIVENNMPLVNAFLNKNRRSFSLSRCEYDDVVQTCYLGLIRAVEKYDKNKNENGTFTTYAFYWIFQYMRRAMSDARMIKISDSAYRTAKEVEENAENIWYAKALCLYEAVCAVEDVESLDEIYEDEDYLYDTIDFFVGGIRYSQEAIDERCEKEELKQILDELFLTITPREADVIRKYYAESDMTYEKIAKEYGLTSNRIRQILVKGLYKLKHPSRRKRLSEWE